MLASILATLCNPYGIEYWRYVLFAITMPRPEITEWGAVWTHHPVVLGCYLTAVVVPAVAWLGSSRRGAAAETAGFALVAYLSASHARHLPFAMILGAAVFIRRWPEFRQNVAAVARNRLIAMPAGFRTALLILLASLGGATKFTREVAASQNEGVLIVPTDLYPIEAISFLKQQRIEGNLYCGFNWGEYCLWHLAPQSQIFCDGRYETVYPAEISRLALGPLVADADRRAIIERFPTEILVVPANAPLADWLAERHDFAEVYRDRVARVFLKRIDKFVRWLSLSHDATVPAAGGAPGGHLPFPG
jgi:hypothetical protein